MSATIAPARNFPTSACSSAATPSKPTSSTYPSRHSVHRRESLSRKRHPHLTCLCSGRLQAAAVEFLFHHERQKIIQSLRRPSIQRSRQRQTISPRRRSSIRPLRQTIAAGRPSQRHQQQSRKRQSHSPVPPERPHRSTENHRNQQQPKPADDTRRHK